MIKANTTINSINVTNSKPIPLSCDAAFGLRLIPLHTETAKKAMETTPDTKTKQKAEMA